MVYQVQSEEQDAGAILLHTTWPGLLVSTLLLVLPLQEIVNIISRLDVNGCNVVPQDGNITMILAKNVPSNPKALHKALLGHIKNILLE